jgi:two-component system, OmpR family, sensor kinase
MRRPSIAWRLAIGLTVMTALLWLGATAIAGLVMQRELDTAYDQLLEQAAYRILPLAMHRIREPGEDDELRVEGLSDREDDEYFAYYVVRKTGSVVIRAEDVPDSIVARTIPDGFSSSDGRRVFALTDGRSGFQIVVLEHTEHRAAALTQSLGGLLWPLLALIPLIVIGIWYAIGLAMRPVAAMSRDIAVRDRRNLTPLNIEGQPVELAPIAEAVADLLGRLRSALAAERAFAASSAHELRTPIAGALAQVQQLAIELGSRPEAHRLREVEAALRHLAQLSEKLLQLSRLEAGFARSDREVDLTSVLRLVVRDFQSSALYHDRVTLTDNSSGTLRGSIDIDAFAIAIRNLVENALLHGASDGPVLITVEPGNVVQVANEGPVVPTDLLETIAEPFARGVTTAKGTGLGLSIVRTIMEQTGGTLALHSPATGRTDGFEAILTLA